MSSPEQQIEAAWQGGQDALALAAARATRLRETRAADSAALDAAVTAMWDGDLATALVRLSDCRQLDALAEELKAALLARNRVVELAMHAYGDSVKRLARGFDNVAAVEDVIAETWVKILMNVYRWKRRGSFRGWLLVVFRNELRDAATSGARAAGVLDSFAIEQDLLSRPPPAAHAPLPHVCEEPSDGTTRRGQRLALQGLTGSLGVDKAGLWEDFRRSLATGSSGMALYEALAARHGMSPTAVSTALLRIKQEFTRMVGAQADRGVEAAEIVAVWFGSVAIGRSTTLLAKTIDTRGCRSVPAVRPSATPDRGAYVRMIETMAPRFPKHRRVLVVADDSAGLQEAIAETLGDRVVVQPCVDTIVRAVVEAHPPGERARARKHAENAYRIAAADRAHARLIVLLTELASARPALVAELGARIDASMTVKRLGLSAKMEDELCRVQFLADRDRAGSGVREQLSRLYGRVREVRTSQRRSADLQKLVAFLSGP